MLLYLFYVTGNLGATGGVATASGSAAGIASAHVTVLLNTPC